MHFRIVFILLLAITAGMSSEIRDQRSQESFWKVYTSALRGEQMAQYQVGVMYERGIGVEQNQAQSVSWYEKSARQGYIDAQYNLALMYASGRGVEKNLENAMVWLSKAAKQGDKEARKLLLEIIDGKHDDAKVAAPVEAMAGNDDALRPIPPSTLVTKDGAQVCTGKGECRRYQSNMVLTSVSMRGSHYKISGTVTKKGWRSFDEDGWIDAEHVRIRE